MLQRVYDVYWSVCETKIRTDLLSCKKVTVHAPCDKAAINAAKSKLPNGVFLCAVGTSRTILV